VAEEFRFIIFTGPVPVLYADPIKVKVERDYIRAARGGTGFAKCGGNYGGAFLPTLQARQQGYDQVLWTDARENRFIEESGMMNIFFVINNTLVTPPLSDSILDGITRDSLLTIARDLAYKTEERQVSVEELQAAFRNGTITEAFGAGTAAVVAPIGMIGIDGTDHCLPAYTRTSISSRLKIKMEKLRTGQEEDRYNWNYIIG
jgi:branched-chain amino acid aminotransferase